MQFFHTHISPKAIELVNQTLKSGFINQGPRVDELEKKFEELGYYNPVTVNSCTSALHLALEICNVRGYDVILPSQSFIATALSVLYAGAKPVFADVKSDGNISGSDVERKINEKTKAIICVSWGGNIPNLGKLKYISQVNEIPLIQDNAHSFGSTYYGNLTQYSDFSTYSFQCIKTLNGADGGMLCCADVDNAKLAKKLSWFGMDRSLPRNELGERTAIINELGYKYHMNDLTASLILGNLSDVDQRIEKRREIYRIYKDIKNPDFHIVKHHEGSSHWLCNCLIENRLDFVRKLKSYSIPTSRVDGRMDKHPIFDQNNYLPGQDYIDKRMIHIPLHEGLTDDDVNLIVKTIEGGW